MLKIVVEGDRDIIRLTKSSVSIHLEYLMFIMRFFTNFIEVGNMLERVVF